MRARGRERGTDGQTESTDAYVLGQAVEAHPEDANALGALGSFLFNVRQEREEAGRLLRSAVQLDAGHTSNIGNLALFLSEGNEAERQEAGVYFARAVEEEPSNICALGRLAVYQERLLGDSNAAEATIGAPSSMHVLLGLRGRQTRTWRRCWLTMPS
jgi:Flp pilus assembly protein TadD